MKILCLSILLLAAGTTITRSGGYTASLQDTNDLPPSSPASFGLPVWHVSEPDINLWIRCPIVRYTASTGKAISLDLGYCQRSGWSSSWQATLTYSYSWYYNPDTKTWKAILNNDQVLNPPLGGSFPYVPDGSTSEYYTYSTMAQIGTLNWLVPGCGVGYQVSYPDGTIYSYTTNICTSCAKVDGAQCNQTLYIDWLQDPQGRRLHFNYTQNSGILQLQSITDYDGKSTQFFYDLSNRTSRIVDPYNRTNQFFYDTNGNLTNIVNPANMSIMFGYDAAGVVTNLVTPHGTNSFAYTVNTNSGNVVSRSMLVAEPDGRTSLFLYRNQSSLLNDSTNLPLLPFAYGTNEIPSTAPLTNTFDNTWMDARNSFSWSPLCYSKLSSGFLQSHNFGNLTTNDYRMAHLKHWLYRAPTSSGIVANTLSMERLPTPDGILDGTKIWYDYAAKQAEVGTNLLGQTITNYYSTGSGNTPSFTAMILSDGTTHFSYAEYNSIGLPTLSIGTYSVGGGIALRTNTFIYGGGNALDLTEIHGPSGELLASNLFNLNHQITLSYNAVGDKQSFTYNQLQQMDSMTTPTGLVITNVFNTSGSYSNFLLWTGQQGGAGKWMQCTYSNGLVSSEFNERHLTNAFTWDVLQRPTSASGPNGTMTFVYTNLSLMQTIDQMQHTNLFFHDPSGKEIYRVDSLGRTNWSSYYAWGGLQAVTNALNQTTFWTYDNLARVIRTTGSDGSTSTNVYDPSGKLIQTFDPSGNPVSFAYNNQGLVTAISNAYGVVAIGVFDSKNRIMTAVDANGNTNTFTYDLLNRITRHTLPDNTTEFLTYNAYGLVRYTNALSQYVLSGYDALGHLTAQTNANNYYVQFNYDQSGNLTNLVDQKGQSTTWGYDVLSRVTNKVDAVGSNIFIYTYDACNRLTNRWSIAKGNAQYAYDSVGNLVGVLYSNSPGITYYYDSLNRVTNILDGVGSTVLQYTVFGNLLSEDGPWANDTVTYSYTPNHLLNKVAVQQPNGSPWSQSMSYDAANRLTNIVSAAGAFGYNYNLAGSLITALALPNGCYTTNFFDSSGRLKGTCLKNSANSVLESDAYSYDSIGQMTNHIRADGSYMNVGYDAVGQVATALAFEATGTSRPHETFGFTYDAAGNVNFLTNNALLRTFNLNSLNQLTAITRSGTLTVAGTTSGRSTNVTVSGTGWASAASAALYADNTWARTNATLASGANSYSAFAQDSLGRSDTNTVAVTLPATISFNYDLNGNLTSDGVRGFDYDDDNLLVRVTITNVSKSEFTYDGLGRRRMRTEYAWENGSWLQTNQVRYVYGGNLVLQERGGDNLARVSFTHGLDISGSFDSAGGIGGLLARSDSLAGPHYYFRADGAGNITSLINTQQCFVARYLYSPFGKLISKSGPLSDANLYRFSSKEFHAASDLYYFGSRFYDANLQRWLNRDPIGETGGLNLYAFVGNNPLSGIDPWGNEVSLLYNVGGNGGGSPSDWTASTPGSSFPYTPDSGSSSPAGVDDGPQGLQKVGQAIADALASAFKFFQDHATGTSDGAQSSSSQSFGDASAVLKNTYGGAMGDSGGGGGGSWQGSASQNAAQVFGGFLKASQAQTASILDRLSTPELIAVGKGLLADGEAVAAAASDPKGFVSSQIENAVQTIHSPERVGAVAHGLLVTLALQKLVGLGEAEEMTATRAFWVGPDGELAAKASGAQLLKPSKAALDAAKAGDWSLMRAESAQWAKGAKGVVPVFFGNGKGRIFLNDELPELLKNIDAGKVKSIDITF